jgi:hypothetical protein
MVAAAPTAHRSLGRAPGLPGCDPNERDLVFSVDHAAGERVVRMKPAPDKRGEFIKEQWATRRAQEAGVPTPEVLEVGHAVGGHPYMIARRVRGEPASCHPDRLRVVREMSRLTAAINAIPTAGWGTTFDGSHNRLSRNADWRSLLKRELCIEPRLAALAEIDGLDAARIRRLRAALRPL